jgi:hypothetical protein
VIAAVAALALQSFRYERTLTLDSRGPIELMPDGAMYAHAQSDFADVRVLDARGDQVPWRFEPDTPRHGVLRVPVLDSGRRGALAVARVRVPTPVARLDLVVPDRSFVGVATAYGSSDGRTWTRLSATQIYDVSGAEHARSTTVLLPRNDFHYLELRASHVSRISGVTVTTGVRAIPLEPLPAQVRTRASTVVVDLGHANVPVDELRVTSTTLRYDRAFVVSAREGEVASGELVRLGPPTTTVIPVSTRTRFLRLRIANGDDPALRGLHVAAYAHPRPLLLEGGHRGPFRIYYGARIKPPVYDFARLPIRALDFDAAAAGALGAEHANPEFRIVDTRSVFAKHRSLVTLALALCAGAVIAAGAYALRRT